MTEQRTEAGKAVAIVGVGCRFPGGVQSPDDFWRLLSSGVDAISEIPANRIDLSHFYDPRPATPGRMMTRWGGFLDHIDEFDPGFFGISPREAERMDPQQRLVLETAWEALEDAGIDARRLEGSNAGVFVGQWLNDFEARLFADPEGVDFQMTTGSGRYATSGRTSYVLGLRGPSITLDTACSSSLAAVHFAVRSIRDGQCSLALAGGVNVILQPHISVAYSQSRMMAPDGRCKFGDASGDGYVRSEGAALIVLKALDQALADGDRIYAVVRGTAVNNDGRSSGSMGTPSRVGQEELLRSAYRDAGLAPGRVGYVEAHGTGTRAGDPVELGALGAVLGEGRAAGQRAFVGSVKTNFGHTEGAAGVAGLIKVALALHHGAIPPNLHFKTPNPTIPWAEAPFQIPTSLQPWPLSDGPKVGGVSAFGIAGTNAHIVLEQAIPPPSRAELPAARDLAVLPLSAASPEALHALAGRYADLIDGAPPAPLQDVCWNAALTRAALDQRAVFVAADRTGMAEALRRYVAGEAAAAEGAVHVAAKPKIAFVLPGQGAQWTGMARELAAREPEFRSALEQCDAAARKYVDWSIIEQLAAEPGTPTYKLDRIDVIQPVLVALAIAYARLWRSLGVVPAAVVGHSMGEVGAAYIAGVLDLDQAMRIICRRSALMRRTSGQGAMALVDLSMDEARARIAGREQQISVAVSNSPRSSVISGDPEAIREVMAGLEAEQVFCRLVKVDVASHSPQMEPLAAELKAELADLRPQPAHTPIYSTVLARRAEGEEFGAGYWASNMRQPVMFGQAIGKLVDDGVTVFIELGPHPVLLPSVAQTAQARSVEALTIACGRREEPEQATFCAALGALWAGGVEVDWRLVMGAMRPRISLPLYPWQRERHWVEVAEMDGATSVRCRFGRRFHQPPHALLGTGLELGGTPAGKLWEVELNAARLPHIAQHSLYGADVLPASVYVELALAAARELMDAPVLVASSLAFEQALFLKPGEFTGVQVSALARDGALELGWHSAGENGWTCHARAMLHPGGRAEQLPRAESPTPDVVRHPCGRNELDSPRTTARAVAAADFYAGLEDRGAGFGKDLRAIARAWSEAGCAVADLAQPEEALGLQDRYIVHPAVLDGCFQLAVAAMPSSELWMPSRVDRIICDRSAGDPVFIEVRARDSASPDVVIQDVTLHGRNGELLRIEGLHLHRLTGQLRADPRRWLTRVEWEPAEEAVEPAMSQVRDRVWILIADDGGLATVLEERLQAQGAVVRCLDAATAADALDLGPLLAHDGRIARIEVVYLRGLDLGDSVECAAQVYQGLVSSLQQLDAFDGADRRCWLVTRGARAVLPEDAATLAVVQAPLWGIGAAAAEEHPAFWGGCLDVDACAPPAEQAQQLIDAWATAFVGDAAFRGGRRFVSGLSPVDPNEGGAAPYRLKPDATYLVTGGLGGIGVHVARWLVSQGARRLAILGRTALAPRDEWSRVAAQSHQGKLAASIRALEALGASVHYAAVDVADADQLQHFLDDFSAQAWPPIRGLIHAAGVTDDCLLANLRIESMRRVLAGKMLGAWHLDRFLPDLDHFILFSSVASLLAQPGQASYAAANAFLDALAWQRRARGQAALSVNWGVWQGVGFASTEGGAQANARLARFGIQSFDVDGGLAALSRLLASGLTQSGVFPIDTEVLHRTLAAGGVPSVEVALLRKLDTSGNAAAESANDGAKPESLVERLQLEAPERRRQLMEERLTQLASAVLRLSPARLDRRTPLGSYGLNSLMALELRNRIEGELVMPLSATMLWNYPTIAVLAEYLIGRVAPATDGDSVSGCGPIVSAAVASRDSQAIKQAVDEVRELSDADALSALARQRSKPKGTR